MGRPLTLCLSLLAVLLSVQLASSVDPPVTVPTVAGSCIRRRLSLSSFVAAAERWISGALSFAVGERQISAGASSVGSRSGFVSAAFAGEIGFAEPVAGAERREEREEVSEGGGLSGKKKAGIAVAVIVVACVVVFGGVVYKKRQDNIRRSQYGYAARREIL
ncbi:hypothetical protein L1049_013261 [Liquidambar formosana]|uniref:Uncharacterized protein n=1 Tax=Liquidambar formosana TaxID=63359 RepID=A0AAP0RK97_LIQFO